MAAIIIPFKRPDPKPASTTQGIPPPLVHVIDSGNASFWGTKEQLVEWGVIPVQLLPAPPKRRAYAHHPDFHDASLTICVHRKGLVCAHAFAGRDESDYRAWIDRLVARVRASSDDRLLTSSALLTVIHRWSVGMISSDGYYAGLYDALKKPEQAFTLAAIEIALYRKPPDETEPEHAQ